ncbi:hypothetical protein TorRG33x02_124460 [Trema orientale]|uniref:Uncharacterized protein n=1 Tax=Trema orientale TaxID=63057 RepID=A0A2P5F243_TREOI|nr:hypothetical protein TorRG33x02_124460 [Trema orientale]
MWTWQADSDGRPRWKYLQFSRTSQTYVRIPLAKIISPETSGIFNPLSGRISILIPYKISLEPSAFIIKSEKSRSRSSLRKNLLVFVF